MINNLAITSSERKAEFTKRSKSFDEQKFEFSQREVKEDEGWVVSRELKSSVKMRKPKSIDEVLENRFWCVLYKLGYQDLNIGRKFTIPIKNKHKDIEKQIDVFAKDDETIIVAECKASKTLRKRSMLKDLGEFEANKKPIADAIRKHYGRDFKPKILWFFVTDNIRWSENDSARAQQNNIHVIKSRELLYFEEFAKKLGKASKYQFHAEYLSGQSIPALSGRKIPAVATKLSGKRAYIFSAPAIDILRIAFVNHRDLRDPSGAPSYQRLVNPSRLKQIGKFLDDGGYFPNTILLNFHSKPRFDKIGKDTKGALQFGELYLPDKYKSCWVVDGQHRLYGCTAASETTNVSNLFFVAFDGISAVEEANTFVTINDKQTKVPKKLIAELDGDIKWDSENPKERLLAIASRAVDLLNTKGNSPFEGKVVTPGVSASATQPLNLPQIQQAITKSKLVGSVSTRTGEILPGPCWEKDSEGSLHRLVKLLSWHFENVEDANHDRWHAGKTQYLCSNFGVASHIRLVSELITYVASEDHFNPIECELAEIKKALTDRMKSVLKFISEASSEEFEARFKVPFGSGGLPRYYFKLVELVRRDYPDWQPAGFDDYIQTISDEEAADADNAVKWIQTEVPNFVIAGLKQKYGDSFFERGVPKDVQKKCQSKRIEDDPDKQMSVETYLDWVDIKKIAEQKGEKEKFQPYLSIRLDDEPRKLFFHTKWFDLFNETRRIQAHPMGRQYREDDLVFLKLITSTLKGRLLGTERADG